MKNNKLDPNPSFDVSDFISNRIWGIGFAIIGVGIMTTGVMLWAVIKLVSHFTN